MIKAIVLGGLIVSAVTLTSVVDANALGGHGRNLPSFSEIDENGDGQLTMEEFQALRAGHFLAADVNEDGVLTREELSAHAQSKAEEHVSRMLERMDADGDGALSVTEMGSRKDRGMRMYERADANSDGAISKEEYEQAMTRHKERRDCGHGN